MGERQTSPAIRTLAKCKAFGRNVEASTKLVGPLFQIVGFVLALLVLLVALLLVVVLVLTSTFLLRIGQRHQINGAGVLLAMFVAVKGVLLKANIHFDAEVPIQGLARRHLSLNVHVLTKGAGVGIAVAVANIRVRAVTARNIRDRKVFERISALDIAVVGETVGRGIRKTWQQQQ